jgi:hypothetical protein
LTHNAQNAVKIVLSSIGPGSCVRKVERTAQMLGMGESWRETPAPYDEERELKVLTSSMWQSRLGRM